MVVDLLSAEGFSVEPSGVGPDGGVDAFAEQAIQFGYNNDERFVWAVQCKFTSDPDSTISPSAVGEILNVVSDERFATKNIRGYFLITNGRLSTNMMSQLRGLNGKLPNFRTTFWDRSRVSDALQRNFPVYSKYFSYWSDAHAVGSSFVRAFNGQPADKREAVEERLNILASTDRYGAMLVENLHCESHLPAPAWQQFIDVILGVDLDSVEMEYSIIKFFRTWIACGQIVPLPSEQVFGSFISVDNLTDLLVQEHRYATRGSAKAALMLTLHKSSVDKMKRQFSDVPIGRFLTRATFSRESLTNPFGDIPNSSDEFLSQFGVDNSVRHGGTILMEYQLASDNSPRTPTICDYYAGGIRVECRVPTPFEYFAWTLPRNPSIRPRPEIVHKPITFNELTEPLILLP